MTAYVYYQVFNFPSGSFGKTRYRHSEDRGIMAWGPSDCAMMIPPRGYDDPEYHR